MWRAITGNWQIKLMALVLAVLVWMYADSVVIKTTEVEVELKIDYPSSVDIEVRPGDRLVRLTLSGPAGAVNELPRRRIQLMYTVEQKDVAGEDRVRTIVFDREMIRGLPSQVRVVKFTPSSFELRIRPLDEKRFTAVLPENQTVGTPSRGYKVAWARIIGKNRVTVSGPAAVLRRIEAELDGKVEVMPVDVSNRAESFKELYAPIRSEVRFADGTVERILCTDAVEVYVEIKREDVETVVKGVPITLRVAPGFTHEIVIDGDNPVDIALKGPPDLLDKIDPLKLVAYIDVRARKPGTEKEVPFTEKLIVLGLPEGVQLSKDVHVKARFKLPEKKEPETRIE